MTAPGAAPGDRFRRRALKRGYKVDEVDEFLERVEDTLAGRARGGPVTADDVREVVFRVRFGGYDEWQVDKHLDRLERQLDDLGEATEEAPTQVVPAVGEQAGRDGRAPAPSAGTTYGTRDEAVAGNSRGAAEDGRGPAEDGEPSWVAGRHGKTDMTMEMPQYGPGSPFTPGDATRIGELRATFKPRRFGSGYAQPEVDRLFDGIAAVITGRSGGSIDTDDLDGSQFELVQGGYFEDEVDAALREVREIIDRQGR